MISSQLNRLFSRPSLSASSAKRLSLHPWCQSAKIAMFISVGCISFIEELMGKNFISFLGERSFYMVVYTKLTKTNTKNRSSYYQQTTSTTLSLNQKQQLKRIKAYYFISYYSGNSSLRRNVQPVAGPISAV